MRKVTGKQFIYQINRPEYIMYDEPYNGMVIIPTDHYGIKTEYKV